MTNETGGLIPPEIQPAKLQPPALCRGRNRRVYPGGGLARQAGTQRIARVSGDMRWVTPGFSPGDVVSHPAHHEIIRSSSHSDFSS